MTATTDITELFLTDPMLKECWCVHEALQRLGFSGASVFLVIGANQAVLLRANDKEFTINLGVHPKGGLWFADAWTRFATALTAGEISDDLLLDTWETSSGRKNALNLVLALSKKGIEVPFVKRH